MKLSPRKEKILKAVVSSYIDNCEPVSSLEIHDKYFPDVSSATIRNELATLEELGYLTHPHVSAGRIPTAQGYRMYVDKLMPRRKLSRSELKTIKHYISGKVNDIEVMVRNTARVISQITNLTAVGYVQNQKSDVVKSVKIVKISESAALFIIVTDRTVLKDSIATLSTEVSEQYLMDAGRHISILFGGHTIAEISAADRFAKMVRKEYEKVFDTVIKILRDYGEDAPFNLSVEGSAKLLSQPEYSNLGKAKAMLELLEAKEQLIPILNNSDMNLSIKISGDGELRAGMPECAIVTASYTVDGVSVANAGVIGPIRMDYPKVISVLDYIGKAMAALPDCAENCDENTDNDENAENIESDENI